MKAPVLESHHIVDLIVFIDNAVIEPPRPQGGWPKLGTYGAYVAHCHRLLPQLLELLGQLLVPAQIQLVDSTKHPVCHNHRKDRYKVTAGLAGWGRNWQGFWFGFKLHAAVALEGQLSNITFTPADVYDGHVTPRLVRHETKIVVGDGDYGDKIARKKLWREHGVVVWRQFITSKYLRLWLHGSKNFWLRE